MAKKPKRQDDSLLAQLFFLCEAGLRLTARHDKSALLRAHLKDLGLPDRPRLLLYGTVFVVQACLAYLSMDGRPFDTFLEMQRYDPADAPGAVYSLTFSLCRKAYARLLVGPNFCTSGVDFADLFDHPWNKYRVAGFDRVWIARLDGKALGKRETARLEKQITEDLLYDFTEDEIEFNFDEMSWPGKLSMMIQERIETCDE